MGKKHKTREQKILADKRRIQSFSQQTIDTHQIHPPIQPPQPPQSSIAVSLSEMTLPQQVTPTVISQQMHVASDLRKIAILTAGIVIAQFILYYVLQRGIFAIPGIEY